MTALIDAAITFLALATSKSLNILITGGAGFIGSNLTLALQEKFPDARLTVIDDFRSGDFKNLAGYQGDLVAADMSRLNWREQFGDQKFEAIFHMASITDTTDHDQFRQTHDNVESFRRLLNFARPNKSRIVYASSASTYGSVTGASSEGTEAAPKNIYAFSKVIMDNIARREAASNDWIIVGLRFFNVYGPREAHKGVPASMIYHLSLQTAGYIAGAFLLLIGLWGLIQPDSSQVAARSLPRSRVAGFVLFTIAFFWSFWLLATMEMGEFSGFRKPLLFILPVGFLLVLRT